MGTLSLFEWYFESVRVTHLVAEHADGGGRGHLVGAEPDGGEAGRDAEHEDLGDSADGLAGHEDEEGAGVDGDTLDPGAEGVEEGSEDGDDPQTAAVEEPGGRQDERDVGQHVDHRQPVDGELVDPREVRQGYDERV